MAVLYHVPILHASAGGRDKRSKTLDPQVLEGLEDATRQYLEILVPSFLDQLGQDGLLNRKKKFIKPVYVFVDGWSRPGHELVQKIRDYRLHEELPFYELVSRLNAAGAVVQKTELPCLLGHTPPFSKEEREEVLQWLKRMDFLRERYMASRVRRILLSRPDAIGILFIGLAHQTLTLPEEIKTLVYHRADCFEEAVLKAFCPAGVSPMVKPDNFGHIPAALEREEKRRL